MNIFLDSSVLIEYLKGKNAELLEHLISSEFKLFVNSIVFSEFMFHYLAIIGNKSPLSIKESKLIQQTLDTHNPQKMFTMFTNIAMDQQINSLSYQLMGKYNLLPNDALILATIKSRDLKYLASFDKKDFIKACEQEEIQLITSLKDL